MRAASNAWIVHSEATVPAEVALIPGGGLETRPFAAAEMFHENRARELVLFTTEVLPTQALGLTRPSHELIAEILSRLEVPDSAVVLLSETEVTSTWDEVLATEKWAVENGVKSLIVVTEIFPSRRVAWAYRKRLHPHGIDVFIHAVRPSLYRADNWWHNEHGLISFQNEVVKYFYYRMKYGPFSRKS
ncbi:MAG: ElyC/SanA/YdcF family protein [Verrucomicrobiota bacterium]